MTHKMRTTRYRPSSTVRAALMSGNLMTSLSASAGSAPTNAINNEDDNEDDATQDAGQTAPSQDAFILIHCLHLSILPRFDVLIVTCVIRLGHRAT